MRYSFAQKFTLAPPAASAPPAGENQGRRPLDAPPTVCYLSILQTEGMAPSMSEFRIERDSMGEMKVPAAAYYGAQTQRAVENFPISGRRLQRRFIRALGLIKRTCAQVNFELGLLDPQIAAAIEQAADEVASGAMDGEFVIDVYQTGSGTSTNMNANEVIANRAVELLGGQRGDRTVHPNDHVNRGQSSNDVIPTAMNVSVLEALERDLRPSLQRLHDALVGKAQAWDRIVKIGRTHLMDATPIRLGQEFSGYASMLAHHLRRLDRLHDPLGELAIGGTAVGTGLNTHPELGRRVAARLATATGLPFREAENHFEAQGSRDAIVEASGVLKTIAASLTKIANDIRLLNSGPRSGLGEVRLPAIQPGSSIMPGKVNPVLCEMLTQVCAQVVGYDAAITLGGMGGQLELNVWLPMMLWSALDSIALLSRACQVFAEKAVDGMEPDEERCRGSIEGSLAMCTSLAPVLGYDAAADIAKAAFKSGKTVRQVAMERGVLPAAELERRLDPWSMTEPGGIRRERRLMDTDWAPLRRRSPCAGAGGKSSVPGADLHSRARVRARQADERVPEPAGRPARTRSGCTVGVHDVRAASGGGPRLRPFARGAILVLAAAALGGCGGLRFPLDEPLTKTTFAPRREPEQIEVYFQHSGFVTTISGSSGVARSLQIQGASRREAPVPYRRLRKIRTPLILRAVNDPDVEVPTDEMIQDGLGQLRDAAAEAGADALIDVFAWAVFDGYHVGPHGVVLQGVAVRYEDR